MQFTTLLYCIHVKMFRNIIDPISLFPLNISNRTPIGRVPVCAFFLLQFSHHIEVACPGGGGGYDSQNFQQLHPKIAWRNINFKNSSMPRKTSYTSY